MCKEFHMKEKSVCWTSNELIWTNFRASSWRWQDVETWSVDSSSFGAGVTLPGSLASGVSSFSPRPVLPWPCAWDSRVKSWKPRPEPFCWRWFRLYGVPCCYISSLDIRWACNFTESVPTPNFTAAIWIAGHEAADLTNRTVEVRGV